MHDADIGWEFWMDVGGTFTDCLARGPDGTLRTHKLLSSGVYRGRLAAGSTRSVLKTTDRAGDPFGFFVGFQVVLLDAAGAPLGGGTAEVASFDPAAGAMELKTPLGVDPAPGRLYELSCGGEAPVVGVRWLLGRPLNQSVGAVRIRLGTTRGTNALLERRGAATAFVATRGFGDVLRIGYQNRPRLFDLAIRKPTDLYQAVVEVDERIDAGGNILQPLDPAAAERLLAPLREQGVVSLAVCLMNSYRRSDHEELVARAAAAVGFEHVSLSSRLSPLQRIVPRGETTVVDAYLTPILRDYVAGIQGKLPRARIQMMTSAGSLAAAETFVGKDSVLSGPAGGVVGVARAAAAAGLAKVVGFDMGGTSTDVCRYDGTFERRYVMELSDARSNTHVRIVAPMLAIETVAAGGGSLCTFDGQRVVVGPRSAGSDPGPACYGRGGPLCVTDVNVALGRVPEDQFSIPLDRDAVDRRLDALVAEVATATGKAYTREELAAGFVAVANANMAAAVKKVSIARGYDLRDHALVSFGGAGGQHACALARELGMRTVLQHPYAGILSAFGIGNAAVSKFAARDVGLPLDQAAVVVAERFAELESETAAALAAEETAGARVAPPCRLLDLRYVGQDAVLTIPEPADGDYGAAFAAEHRRRFGFAYPGRAVDVRAARVEQTAGRPAPAAAVGGVTPRNAVPRRVDRAYFDGAWRETAIFHRADLQPGDRFTGPAVVVEGLSTVVVEPGWSVVTTAAGDLLLTDELGRADAVRSSTDCDPVALELFNNLFTQIAEQMG
ncbi:MAG: hydantoinase/oxoprolinase family protein, partial [Planctomycetia bacterium]